MRLTLSKLASLLWIVPLTLLLFGCTPAKPTVNPNLTWGVSLLKYDVKDKLEGYETVNQYVGTTQVFHQQFPSKGNVYLILDLTVSKQGTAADPFDWSKLIVQDAAGNSYSRSSNDTFLEQYQYTPRMTGLQMVLGVNQGWVCYEIPAAAANGKLTLSYSAAGSQQQIAVK